MAMATDADLTRLEVDLGAIAANWRALTALHPGGAVAGVVKADAYGLGALQVAPALHAAGCRHFFTAHLSEAVAIRGLVPGAMVAVLNGIPAGSEGRFVAHEILPVLGTPGGSRIISMVLLGILRHVHTPAPDLPGVVGAPRYHHQYLPDRIEFEPGGFSTEWVDALKAKGHVVQEGKRRWGNMQGVFVDRHTGEATAAGDPRGKAGVLF